MSTELSNTLVESDQPWEITYGAGHVSGRMISDDFSFGPFDLQAHVFGIADIETDHFANSGTLFDGVFGTAHSVSPLHHSSGISINDLLSRIFHDKRPPRSSRP